VNPYSRAAKGGVLDSIRGKAAIAGIGELKPVRYTQGETTLGMMLDAGLSAIEDSGVAFDEVDGILAHSMGGLSDLVPSAIVEMLGVRARFAEVVDLGGATGAGMVWRAAAAIASGLCETCLCLTGARREKRRSGWGGPRERSAFTEFDVPYGAIGANYGYAQIAMRYMHEYSLEPEQLAKIAVHQRDNACANPDAIFYGQPITIEDVLSSPMIVDPLRMLEIVMPVGGASALVVTSAERAKSLPNPPAFVLGAGEYVTHKGITYAPSLTDTPVKPAADMAFEMAGIGRDRVGLASLYDCYTITVLLTLEDAGFCGKGQGGSFVDSRDLRYNGDFPVNTHGGQLSFGQAGVAGGMTHVTEAARQIQGRGGERQVKDLDFAYVNGNGGTMSEQVGLVLGTNP
jgi:acetyl-CoA acetyltransferase